MGSLYKISGKQIWPTNNLAKNLIDFKISFFSNERNCLKLLLGGFFFVA